MHLLFSVIIAFLPFAVSVSGRGGTWKFLAFLFSAVSLGCFLLNPWGVIWWALVFGTWVVAWIFAGVARSRKDSYAGSDKALRRNIR